MTMSIAMAKCCFYCYALIILFCEPSTGQHTQECGGSNHLISMCITNDATRDCQQPANVTTNITGYYQHLSNPSLRCVAMYFTSGTHLLQNPMVFAQNISNTELIGTRMPQTMIECGMYQGLDFHAKSGRIVIINIIFEQCSTWGYLTPSALFFQNVDLTLENVTVQNSGCGIHAFECRQVMITNCRFYNNTRGHIRLTAHEGDWNSRGALVIIRQSLFYNGSNVEGGALRITRSISVVRETAICIIEVTECIFKRNTAHNGSHLHITQEHSSLLRFVVENIRVIITECTFTESTSSSSVNSFGNFGIFVAQLNTPASTLNVTISRSTISNSINGGIFISNANAVLVDQCKVMNNKGIGIQIIKTFVYYERTEISPVISQTQFYNNTKALDIGINYNGFPDKRRKRQQADFYRKVLIKKCTFIGHLLNRNLKSVMHIYDALETYVKLYSNYITVHIENCKFENNHFSAGVSNSTSNFHCSVLHIRRLYVTITNSSFLANSCTGIALNSSTLRIQEQLNFTQNYAELGGALWLSHDAVFFRHEKPKIIFEPHAKLYLFQNRATEYGGSIYTDETCEDGNKDCFFQLELVQTLSPTFHFEGNRADKGGDAIFGGCLSNCSMESSDAIDIREADSIFWKIVSLSPNDKSQSNFADYPNRVVFCENVSISDSVKLSCKDTHQVTVYRGGTFTVHMMAVGHLCSPSYNIIRAEVLPGIGKGVHIGRGENYKSANTHCDQHMYSLRGGQSNASNFTIHITLTLQERTLVKRTATQLVVNYINHCPSGFWLDKTDDKCICSVLLKSSGVKCMEDYSFDVPSLIWVGIWQERVAVGSYCQHCKTNGVHNIKNTSSSDGLCALNRTGLLCGECVKGYSIQLGGYKCGDCLNSNYKGILLTIAFAIIGFLLIIVSLKLNLTVSTGLINGLILYANVVYSNHALFLPFDREIGRMLHLNNVVHFLFLFQAWLNLDFGFDICYFHGMDAFIVTWLEFVFPLYIWVIIFIIVVVSRYSTRLSKFTGHNTISVLATLLLLSYTKLLLAILSALSYTQLHLIDGRKSHPLWSSDPNIRYVASKHIGLFLMSIFMIFAYILPFTFFVALGPILISKSNYRWIHRIKPFLDAFYGPYTKTYRYWPGILLVFRIILTSIIAFYSAGDGSFVLVTISICLPLLLFLWLLIGRTHQVSLHRNRKLNLLELFFLLNLALFSIISLYLNLKYPKNLHKQQALAVVMVGSVFVIFCCIIAYNIFCTARSWQITNKMISFIPRIRKKRKPMEGIIQQEESNEDSIETYHNTRQPATHSTLEMSHRLKERNILELREPLLEEACS